MIPKSTSKKIADKINNSINNLFDLFKERVDEVAPPIPPASIKESQFEKVLEGGVLNPLFKDRPVTKLEKEKLLQDRKLFAEYKGYTLADPRSISEKRNFDEYMRKEKEYLDFLEETENVQPDELDFTSYVRGNPEGEKFSESFGMKDMTPTKIREMQLKYDPIAGRTIKESDANIRGSYGLPIGKLLLNYYSPVENTISNMKFPEKGLTITALKNTITPEIPKLSKKFEYSFGGLKAKLNELEKSDPNKLYSKEEFINLYKENALYLDARITTDRLQTKYGSDQRQDIFDPAVNLMGINQKSFNEGYFEISLNLSTPRGNREVLTKLDPENKLALATDDDLISHYGQHFQPMSLAHTRGSFFIDPKTKEKIMIVEELQSDFKNLVLMANRYVEQTEAGPVVVKSSDPLKDPAPATEFLSQLLQALIVHAKMKKVNKIVFPSAEQIALQRGAAGTELMPSLTDMANEPIDIVSSKYDMIYNRGLQKTIDKFISQSDNKITKTEYKIPYRYTSEQREEIEKAGLLGDVIDSAVRGRNPEDLQIMSGFSNVFPNLDKPATLLDITNFKFFPKVAQARFSKGGLVKKRGLMRKKVAA